MTARLKCAFYTKGDHGNVLICGLDAQFMRNGSSFCYACLGRSLLLGRDWQTTAESGKKLIMHRP